MNEVKIFLFEILIFLTFLHFVYSFSQNKVDFLTVNQPFQVSDKLFAGSILKEGEFIISQNKQYKAVLEYNGTLVLYKLNFNPFSKKKIWETEKTNKYNNSGNDFRLTMQNDGNLAIYDINNTKYWETKTFGQGRPKQYLQITNKGVLRIKDRVNLTLWKNMKNEERAINHTILPNYKITIGQNLHSNDYIISQNGKFMLMMQSDGDLGLYKIRNKRLIRKWTSNTKKKGFLPFRISVEGNGNIVLFDKYQRRIWTLRTPKNSTNIGQLILQNDGNLVHVVGNKTIWSSETNEN